MKPKFIVKIPVWNQEVEVYVGSPEATQKYLEERFNKKLRKANGLNKNVGLADKFVNKKNKTEYAFIMWLADLSNEVEGLKTITHETTHITHAILRFVGCKPNFSNEESEAYMHEYIFGEIIKYIIK